MATTELPSPARARRGPTSRPCGRDGFTLVEALAAFAILAMLTLVVQRGVVVAMTGLARADARMGAERVARTLLDAPFGNEASRLGLRSGVTDGHAWSVTTEPLDLPPQARAGVGDAGAGGAGAGSAWAGAAGGTAGAGAAGAGGGGAGAADAPAVRWRPVRVTIRVLAPPGREIEIETVRLARVGS